MFTTVDFTKQQYHASIEALIEGALLAVAIVYLFLRDWRATGIAALAIPLAALPTFAFMQWFGFTLNQMSLLALCLITGVLVDDAIVEIENITRHMKMGKSGYRAAMDAADEIGLAVVACSMAIIAVFLPVSFMGGLVGQFFIQFGFTVAVAVFMSLVVARLISPLLAAYTLKPHADLRGADGPLMEWYLRTLRWTVKHRRDHHGRLAACSSYSRSSVWRWCRRPSCPTATTPLRPSRSSCRRACCSARPRRPRTPPTRSCAGIRK